MRRGIPEDHGPTSEAELALQAAYVTLAPRLCREFAKLSSSGVKVSPYDSLDLVHDFFIHQWEAVHSGHQPSKGPLEPYAARSFRRYVIRVVAREGKDRSRAVAYALGTSQVEPEKRTASFDVQVIRSAVDRLPPDQKGVLRTFLDSGSERVAARTENVTRYHARRLLEEAVVNVALHVGASPASDQDALALTACSLRDDEPIGALARRTGRTVEEVREIQKEVLGTLLDSLRSHISRNPMTAETLVSSPTALAESEDVPSLLAAFSEDPSSDTVRRAVAERRDEILLYLSEHPSAPLSPSVYPALYEALGWEPQGDTSLEVREAERREDRRRILGGALL